jgi:hypothetical protein
MKYEELASKEVVEKVIAGLKTRNVEGFFVENGALALAKIKELIPKGASIMNGASVTLEQIGFVDYLKAEEHGWNNLHAAIVAETDGPKQAELRRQALISDYYLGSVHGMAETGEFIVASNTGSQLPHIVFSSQNVILVVSTKKITPTLPEAYQRLMEHVIPLEEVHMQELYGVGTNPSKILTFTKESEFTGRKVMVILVNEDLGF